MSKLFNYAGVYVRGGNIGTIIIAHRGYHVTAFQNTIPACLEAVQDGFNWLELDVRKTSDNFYVLSHDENVTMYNNGVSTSVNIPNSNYETIKNYTWDSAKKYKLCTLQSVFNTLKIYNISIIIDLKNGSNSDIMDIASRCGFNDRVMLTFKTIEDLPLFKKYDYVPIRIYASRYDDILYLQNETVNPLYADFNVQGGFRDMPKAISSGIPLIFSGCTKENKNIWQVLACGVMANSNLNISYNDFYDALKIDYDNTCTITTSTNSVNLNVNNETTITSASNRSTPSGYLYGYTKNPKIADVLQNSWGSNVTFTIYGLTVGNTELVVFTGNGEYKTVNITVE